MLPIANECYPWIDRELIETILKSSSSELVVNVQLRDYQLCDAVAKGENYTSHLIRATVQYCDDLTGRIAKQTAFVFKTTLSKEMHAMIEKMSLFAKEVAFYRNITPKFVHYAKLIDPVYKCSPRCYHINDDPLYLVFEDLQVIKYRNTDRRIGLNFRATEMLLIKLAKFHAIGVMVYDHNPELFVHHTKNIVHQDSFEMMEAFTSGMRDLQELCINWPGYEKYSLKLEKLLKVIYDRVATSFDHDPNAFNTLLHGDLWINNLMYKFDADNNPIDVLMVDYQMGFYGSPAIDLTYLLYTSTSNATTEDDWNRLIQIYHMELVTALKSVNYSKPIPTLTEIHIEILKRSMYSVMVSLAIIVPRFMINTDLADLEHLVIDGDTHKKRRTETLNQPDAIDRAKYLLDHFDRKGYLSV